jgi:hypothetical protein
VCVYFGRFGCGEYRVHVEDREQPSHRRGRRDDAQIPTQQVRSTPDGQQHVDAAAIHERDVGKVNRQPGTMLPDGT